MLKPTSPIWIRILYVVSAVQILCFLAILMSIASSTGLETVFFLNILYILGPIIIATALVTAIGYIIHLVASKPRGKAMVLSGVGLVVSIAILAGTVSVAIALKQAQDAPLSPSNQAAVDKMMRENAERQAQKTAEKAERQAKEAAERATK